MAGLRASPGAGIPLLARLKVGTKLLLLALLPVCALLGLGLYTTVADWRTESGLRDFRTDTRLSIATGAVADRLAAERTAAELARLQPTRRAEAGLAAAQHSTNQALRQAAQQAMSVSGPVEVAGRLGAAIRQLASLRLRTASGSLSAPELAQGYDVIVSDLLSTVAQLIAGRPTDASGQAADAYLAILQATEAAQRSRADMASVLAAPGHRLLPAAIGWVTLESAELSMFRQNATRRLAADLEAVLSSPAGIAVQRVSDEFLASPASAVAHTSLPSWLAASSARITGLEELDRGAAWVLAETASADLRAAQMSVIRDIGLSLALIAVATALALALRRSITRPLREVSGGACTLSGGNLDFDVRYTGRDEIGDVAAAFRDLQVNVGRLAGEIRAANAAISEGRLDHRADVSAFEGTWGQLLAGLNGTMAAFAELSSGRERAERELEDMFSLSPDLLCIAGADGYFKRVNPAFERTLGYTQEELLSRPFLEFIHPDDRRRTEQSQATLAAGEDVIQLENRYICRDGSERWLQWNARSVPEEGVIYCAARDVTDSRRASNEQAALRRVATQVARGGTPAAIFQAVVAEMLALLGTDSAALLRYDPGGLTTVIAARNPAGGSARAGERQPVDDEGLTGIIWRTRRPARLDAYQTGPLGSVASRLLGPGVRAVAGAPIIVQGRLWGLLAAAWPRHPPAGIERRIGQFAELVGTAVANAQAHTDLAASRTRIVAASDETRRRIERNLHDGAQQRLVSLGLVLRGAQQDVPASQPELRQKLDVVAEGIAEVLSELREMSRGIHPAILSTGGLAPALKTLARRSAVPVHLDMRAQSRLPERVEVAAYFVVSEALANAVKHAQASVITVHTEVLGPVLQVVVLDNGVGGADPVRGSGLIGLTDRVEAAGGTIHVTSPAGAGTRIVAELPLDGGDGLLLDGGDG